MTDYHIHTKLCKHAEGEIHSYVEHALGLGLSEIAFTDHIPLPKNFDIAHRMTLGELDTYRGWIEKLRTSYPEITIRFGIEADYYRGFESYTEKILDAYDFDIVIMSIHFLHHWPEGNWVFNYTFPEKSIKEIYIDYLDTVIEGIHTGLFDVVGHVDIIKSSGHSFVQTVPNEVAKLLQSIKSHNMALEINTSGFRKSANESYPGYDWLKKIKSHHVPLTVGSDAHTPYQIGLNFYDVHARLRSEGIQTLSSFNQRMRTEIILDAL